MRTGKSANYIRKIIGLTLVLILVATALHYNFDDFNDLPSEIKLTREELNHFRVGNFSHKISGVMPCVAGEEVITADMTFTMFKVVPVRKATLSIVPERKVYVGGRVVGITVKSDGLIVSGNSELNTAGGKVNTLEGSDLKIGDIIVEIDGVRVTGAGCADKIIEAKTEDNGTLEVKFDRGGKEMMTTVKYVLDKDTGSRKLGLWVRDSIAGVGTLTYTRLDGRYGALGHPIADMETKVSVPVQSGRIFNCNIVGATKGKRGAPGELKGSFARSGNFVGSIDKNTNYGIFGNMTNLEQVHEKDELLPIGNRTMVKPGKAKIMATVDDKRETYDIEIIKTNNQKSQSDKSMIVSVTDKRLLDKVGGIVQGMSGSPIIQNGRIVGAITHVFVNDPTKGYGIYLDWMYNE